MQNKETIKHEIWRHLFHISSRKLGKHTDCIRKLKSKFNLPLCCGEHDDRNTNRHRKPASAAFEADV